MDYSNFEMFTQVEIHPSNVSIQSYDAYLREISSSCESKKWWREKQPSVEDTKCERRNFFHPEYHKGFYKGLQCLICA